MRMKLTFDSPDKRIIRIPVHPNYYLHSYIYSSLPPEDAKELHNTGWSLGKRHFKMFDFSPMYSDSVRIDKRFPGYVFMKLPCWFVLSSPDQPLLQKVAQMLLTHNEARIGNNHLVLRDVSLLSAPSLIEDAQHMVNVDVETMSPITVYQTDDTNHTTYFRPHDAAFVPYVEANARRKYLAYTGNNLNLNGFGIVPLDEVDKAVSVEFKTTSIVGYTGHFHLSGDKDTVRFLLDAGIGTKNSEGFGMVEPITGTVCSHSAV